MIGTINPAIIKNAWFVSTYDYSSHKGFPSTVPPYKAKFIIYVIIDGAFAVS